MSREIPQGIKEYLMPTKKNVLTAVAISVLLLAVVITLFDMDTSSPTIEVIGDNVSITLVGMKDVEVDVTNTTNVTVRYVDGENPVIRVWSGSAVIKLHNITAKLDASASPDSTIYLVGSN